MKKTKLITLLGGVASVLTVAPMVSAGCNNGEHPKAPSQYVANIKVNDALKLDDEQLQKAPKVVMLTDGGDINDKSFNQSAWEAVIAYAKQNNFDVSHYDVIEIKEDKYEQGYDAALESGATIWVLPGFKHEEHMRKYVLDKVKDEAFKKVTLVTIDFSLNLPDNRPGHHWDPANVNPGSAIGILFDTKEGGFLAGYAAGEYLSQEEKAEDRSFTTFGGGPFAGVTDFNEGFYKGILEWNETHADKKVHAEEKSVDLSSDFDPKDSKMTAVVNSVTSSAAKIILPVAGPATYVVTNNASFKANNKLVIGVDTDQALAAPNGKDRFFTSILKKLGQATYEVLGSLASGKLTNDILDTFEKGKTNVTLKKGIAADWVGLSETHLTGDLKERAQKTLDNALAYWNTLSDETKKYIHSGKALKTGAEITDIQKRLNALSAETKK